MIFSVADYNKHRYDTGTISGILAMSYWQNQFSTGFKDPTGHLDVTASQSSEIVSILSAGTFFGALSAAPLGDWVGRRLGLIISSCVFIFGVILQTASAAIPLFVAGRFFAGFGVGLVSALSKSLSPPPLALLQLLQLPIKLISASSSSSLSV